MAFPTFSFTPASVLNNLIFGANLLTGSLRIDVVAIYDGQSFRQLFREARPMKASVLEGNKIMDYPVETGVILSDHKIRLQKQIDLTLVVPAESYNSVYQQISGAAMNSTLLTVQTRAGVYQNMIIESFPHEESPDMYDAITLLLRLKEVMFVAPFNIAQPNSPVGFSPQDPFNTDTIRRGQQTVRSILAIPAAALGYIRTISAWGR